MKILVTGGGGQVGSELNKIGLAQGFKICAPTHAEMDISNRMEVSRWVDEHQPEMVINAAAYTKVDLAETEIETANQINRDGVRVLADVCKLTDVPLLHLSTDYVFDGTKAGAYEETDKTCPTSVYGRSKLEGENAVRESLDQHIIIRTAWVFAATGQNFVRTMLRLGRDRDELSVVDDQWGAPTWAGDIARTCLDISRQVQSGGDQCWGIYHYTGQPSINWHGFAKAIFDEALELGLLEKAPMLRSISSDAYKTPVKRPENSVLNCSKIKRVFGIGQADWRIGLRQVLLTWKQEGAVDGIQGP